jgi:glutaconate CoA-transferase, subunit B
VTDAGSTDLLIGTLAKLLEGSTTVAVGNLSPIPAAAALLWQVKAPAGREVMLVGSRRHSTFTDGGRELFDCAAQGRIDVFFLSGGQIDGEANLNLVGTGTYPQLQHRFPGSFGSAYLYFLVPNVILFRAEHSRRVLVPRVDFVSAPGVSPPDVYRPGGPTALVTGRCVFRFGRARSRFQLESIHAGETLESVLEHTGFDFDIPASVPTTAPISDQDLHLLRSPVLDELAETYPRFASEYRADLETRVPSETAVTMAHQLTMAPPVPSPRRAHPKGGHLAS